MSTRNVILTEHFDKFIETGIAEGRFSDVSEAVLAGLQLLERQAAEDKVRIDWLRGAVQEGIDSIERGEFVSLDSPEDIDRFVEGARAEAFAANSCNVAETV